MNAGVEDKPPADPEAMLIEFLRDRDVLCPRCQYNLRNLTSGTCPECREPISLRIDAKKYPLGGLLATVAPGYFAGIVAVILLVAMVQFGGTPDGMFCTVWLFCGLSGLASIAVSVYAQKFIALPIDQQGGMAILSWLVHIVLFFMLIAGM